MSNQSISTPKFQKGDSIVLLPTEKQYYRNINGTLQYPAKFLADYEHDIIVSEPDWHEYDSHPDGGYWEYMLETKANPCPEDFLALYDASAEYYTASVNIR